VVVLAISFIPFVWFSLLHFGLRAHLGDDTDDDEAFFFFSFSFLFKTSRAEWTVWVG
jgi:hypothetical protein